MGKNFILAKGGRIQTCVNEYLTNGLKSVFPVKGQARRTGNQEYGKIQGLGTGNSPFQENGSRPAALMRGRGYQGPEI